MSGGESGTRWILGFDGGCEACGRLAQHLVELSKGKLLAAPLRSCLLLRWREQALGPDAPWLPTLFLVDGEQVQAWIGPAMAMRLARLLGPRKTWYVVRMLGDRDPAREAEAPDPSRRRIVKAFGGAALALGMGGASSIRPTSAVAQEVTAASQVRWTSVEPSAASRRQMDNRFRTDELRTFRQWLSGHGFRDQGAPEYRITRRNGELAFRSIAEGWKENGRIAIINLAIGRNGREVWTTHIYRESDGKLVNRLHLSEARRILNEPGDGITASFFGFDPCDILWCPNSCDLCQYACTSLFITGAVTSAYQCALALTAAFGPGAGIAGGIVCGLFGAYAAGWWQFRGCPAGCGEIGLC